ncbi:MAG TPA: ATP-binding protein [Pyrinomonadaceae bacterium]
MSIDSSVIAAIEAAVKAEPENAELRLHLALLLLKAGRAQDALDHCQKILAAQPDHAGALHCAANASESLGERQRGEGYRRIAAALGGTPDAKAAQGDESKPLAEALEEIFGPDTGRRDDKGEGKAVPRRVVDGDTTAGHWEAEPSDIKLSDVAGMEEVKRRLHLSLLAPLRNPEMMKLYGKSLRGGLLFYGPPGCGKTFIARAVAGEMGARFIAIGLADVLDMYIGQSERNLHEIFETARRTAPCVLFIDEIDALGRKRSLQRHSGGRDVVNQLLSELDSIGNDNRGVFVLAATNHPWDVDTALRRPGRFDRTLLVLPPDQTARAAILRYHLGERPVEGVDLRWVAEKTDGLSGADLAYVVESATELALEESISTGKPRPIRQNDFKRALKEIKPSIRPWFEVARNYAMFSNEGGMYDDLLDYLRAKRML